MANGINNKYEYRSGLLDSLNVQHTASDVRNEDEYRKKVLNGLGVEFTDDDINQKSRYRAKVVEGLASSGGGGLNDFSTAKVTIINNDNTFPCLLVASITREESGSGGLHINAGTVTQGDAGFGTNIHTVVLYKGGALATFLDPDGVETTGFDIEGDIEEQNNNYFITGDCTVTINPVP